MRQTRGRQNYLGARGWVWAGPYQLERYLYLLHRVTGLGLLLYGILHLTATTFFRLPGQTVWEATMAFVDQPWFKAGEFLVATAFVFHALNGLRLILQELGFLLGRPTPPIYPYRDALRKKRAGTIAMLAVIVILVLVFLFDFTVGGW